MGRHPGAPECRQRTSIGPWTTMTIVAEPQYGRGVGIEGNQAEPPRPSGRGSRVPTICFILAVVWHLNYEIDPPRISTNSSNSEIRKEEWRQGDPGNKVLAEGEGNGPLPTFNTRK